MHLKRKNIPKIWPIKRTGCKYLAVARHDNGKAIPLVIAIRDMLKITETRKELQGLINDNKIIVNDKIIKDKNYPISLFDCISFADSKKAFRLVIKNKRAFFEEENEKNMHFKPYKVIGKKILPGKKIQINLSSGRNILTKEKINVGDYLILDFKNNIQKIVPLKKGCKVIVIKGKHIGKEGEIKEITNEGGEEIALLEYENKKIKVNSKNIFIK
jgi:ribosomal protein S4E